MKSKLTFTMRIITVGMIKTQRNPFQKLLAREISQSNFKYIKNKPFSASQTAARGGAWGCNRLTLAGTYRNAKSDIFIIFKIFVHIKNYNTYTSKEVSFF